MKEKLRFRISKIITIPGTTETEEDQKEVQKDNSKSTERRKIEQQYIELLVYDISFEQISLPTKIELLNTEVREVALKQITLPSFDTFLTQHTIKHYRIPTTDLIEVHPPKEALKVADIKYLLLKLISSRFPLTRVL